MKHEAQIKQDYLGHFLFSPLRKETNIETAFVLYLFINAPELVDLNLIRHPIAVVIWITNADLTPNNLSSDSTVAD